MALTTDDRLEIQELYARYNHAIDSGKARVWAETFTPDGTFDSGQGVQQGSDALAQFASGFASQMKARHWINNLVIDETDGGARGSCYLVLYNLAGEAPAIMITGIYEDSLVKTEHGWRFASRKVRPD